MEVLALERTRIDSGHVRPKSLVHRVSRDRSFASRVPHIEDDVDAAAIVPSRQGSPDVAAVHAQVLLLVPATGRRRQLTTRDPEDAEPPAGFVSVLSPVRRSLPGLRVGPLARWARRQATRRRRGSWPSPSSPRPAATT